MQNRIVSFHTKRRQLPNAQHCRHYSGLIFEFLSFECVLYSMILVIGKAGVFTVLVYDNSGLTVFIEFRFYGYILPD